MNVFNIYGHFCKILLPEARRKFFFVKSGTKHNSFTHKMNFYVHQNKIDMLCSRINYIGKNKPFQASKTLAIFMDEIYNATSCISVCCKTAQKDFVVVFFISNCQHHSSENAVYVFLPLEDVYLSWVLYPIAAEKITSRRSILSRTRPKFIILSVVNCIRGEEERKDRARR